MRKTNWITDKRGYRYARMSNHPNANKNGYISEHRFVMSNSIGRPLRPDEIIHHINGNRSDNQIQNLRIVTRREHVRNHNSGENHSLWKGGSIVKSCVYCGKDFDTHAHNRNESAKYCSRKCYWNSMSGPTKTCVVCGKEFRPRNPATQPGKYCSMKCSGIGRGKHK